VVILLPNFIQLQITSNSNKTANVYVKKLFKHHHYTMSEELC